MTKTKNPSKTDERYEFLLKVGRSNARKLRENATKWEKIMYKHFKDIGVNFEFQKPIVIRKKYLYIMDFYFPETNICIEIDSKQYHSSKEDVKKDRIRTRRLKTQGIFVIRLWNSMVSVLDVDRVKKILKIENPLISVKKENTSLKDK